MFRKLGNHPDFALAHFEWQNISHQLFLDRTLLLLHVQAAWLLVVLCATGNYMSGTKCASGVCEENATAMWHHSDSSVED